jgi:hypothetical protein
MKTREIYAMSCMVSQTPTLIPESITLSGMNIPLRCKKLNQIKQPYERNFRRKLLN